MFKKTIYFLVLIFFVTSCANTWDSVKRGLTGQKRNAADEFLIKKKDPLILPPDYENLPTPAEQDVDKEDDTLSIERTLSASSTENESETSASKTTEESIIKKIRRK